MNGGSLRSHKLQEACVSPLPPVLPPPKTHSLSPVNSPALPGDGERGVPFGKQGSATLPCSPSTFQGCPSASAWIPGHQQEEDDGGQLRAMRVAGVCGGAQGTQSGKDGGRQVGLGELTCSWGQKSRGLTFDHMTAEAAMAITLGTSRKSIFSSTIVTSNGH